MTALTIRADELVMAFEDQGPDRRHYFDRQTGEVLTIFSEMADNEDTARLEADLDRYLLIEAVPSSTGYEIMWDFVETLPEGKVQRELARALKKRRPFRRFKDVLLNYPEVQESWYRFHEHAYVKIIQGWLAEYEVEVNLVPFQSKS